MEINQILKADVLDIIFEGRNKSYGAYELRRTYDRRITTALIAMMGLCLLMFLATFLAKGNDKDGKPLFVKDIEFVDIEKRVNNPEPPPPPPPPTPKPPVVEIAQFTPPLIIAADEVKPEDELKDMKQLEDAKIGTFDVAGVKDVGFVAPPVEKTTGVVETPKKADQDWDIIFKKVEIEAKFPGGPEAWKKYLERNLDANAATNDGAPAGSYRVKVQFIVDKTGAISNVEAIEVPKECPTCGAEAVKIIRKGGNWQPAMQNGRNVIYQAIQYITYQVAEE